MIKIFTVYDSKAEAFTTPTFAPTTAAGMRMFESACNEEGSSFHRYSGDYTLFEIGDFDEHSGQISPHKAHNNLGLASTFISALPQALPPTLKEAK